MVKSPDISIPTRQSLLNRLKNWEDQQSWQDFFNTYWRLIYGVAIKAGLSDAEAQEVVQETFIAVSKKMQDFEYDPSIGSFKSWLLQSTRWRILDQFRKRCKAPLANGRRSESTDRTSTIERIPDPAGIKLEEIWDAEWEKAIFDAALEKVRHYAKAAQYQLFDLYVIKHLPVLKVARLLGVNVGRVYLAKHRISALLRKEMKGLKGKSL